MTQQLLVQSVGDQPVTLNVGVPIPVGHNEIRLIVARIHSVKVNLLQAGRRRNRLQQRVALRGGLLHWRGDEHPNQAYPVVTAQSGNAPIRFCHDFAFIWSQSPDEFLA